MILWHFKLLPSCKTGCQEFIDGSFIVVLLVFLTEIVEKESYHIFIFSCKITFHTLFYSISSIKKLQLKLSNIKIKNFRYIVTLRDHRKYHWINWFRQSYHKR